MEKENTATTKAVATKNPGLEKLKNILKADSIQEQFQNCLKENKDTFISSIIDLYNNDHQLAACNPGQVVKEALKAALVHLPVNKALGQSYIVVYNNNVKQPDGSWKKVPTPTFMVGYRGFIQLAIRSGMYQTINADVVYEGEIRKVDKLTGEIDFEGERKSDKVIGYFCHIKLSKENGGFAKTLYMTVHDMAVHAKRFSKSVGAQTSVADLEKLAGASSVGKKVGWEGNFDAMALKTVTRLLLSKYGYLSVDMQHACTNDSDVDDQTVNRDEEIAANANQQTIDIDAVPVEDVDTETGEVMEEEDDKPEDGQQSPKKDLFDETGNNPY